ncbi:SDR family oxidoreductase [Chitinophaga sp. S165]|uniref:SDR family oxidoreductase n=1 Tax=Chitinophaga sp. S165 TaxID=2135462 RepID=UPI000D70F502|nr:SDR family oxidoreductase [Chitinophaga sp. S165]PWV54458.1 short-subunit dehydrogenase [Chitinophaga sp. S165]
MTDKKRILITGAGSGFGEGTAIGLAKLGHKVIAGVQISPQVTALRRKVEELGLQDNLRVERLDILDAYDVKFALTWDIDILLNNAGIGEAGPTFEIPIDLVRKNFETNVFAALDLTQRFVRKFIDEKRPGKIIFTSSMGGLFTPPGYGIYVATKHALEAIAEALHDELRVYNIKVQTINPGAYLTGYNETMADNPFRWLDDNHNVTRRADMKAIFDSMLGTPQGRLDPTEMIDAMIQIVPADTGKFRNVVPQFVEDMLKENQTKAWANEI